MSGDDSLVPVTVNGARPGRLSRREAMRWVMGAAAASALPDAAPGAGPSATRSGGKEVGRTPTPQEEAARVPGKAGGGGYGVDPNLMEIHRPGEFWPLTFTDAQRATAAALADVIIPNDELGPAASDVGVVEMLDEWVSAPYPVQQADRPVILEGLAWLEAESAGRFGKGFAELSDEQHHAVCDDVCFTETAVPKFARPAAFFARFRALCAGAYYATPAGWEALGYVGNVALERFDGPPQEVLDKLGVRQTVG